MFAIIETGGTQYKVEKGSKLDINKIEEKEGVTIDINKVLLLNDEDTKIGTPYLDGAYVQIKILAHKRGNKIVVFKMKAKKRYQKTQGHRQELTTIEVMDIRHEAKRSVQSKEEKNTKTRELDTIKKESLKKPEIKKATPSKKEN